jgi:tetratricopeptide (TPR) repeat protein
MYKPKTSEKISSAGDQQRFLPAAAATNLCPYCAKEIDTRSVRCVYCLKEIAANSSAEGLPVGRKVAMCVGVIGLLFAGISFAGSISHHETSQPSDAPAYTSLKDLDNKLNSDKSDESKEESQTGNTDQDLNKEVGEWTRAIEKNPKNAKAYLERGWSYNELQQYDNAIYDLTKAIKLNPKSALAYSRRAWVHDTRGEYQKAVVDASRAIHLNPKSAEAYQARACAYASLGESTKAQEDSAVSDRLGTALSR